MSGVLARTPLYERHVALGAKLGGFAGWEMPLEYTTVRDEHAAVRSRCGIFDVSHMGQIHVGGVGAGSYLEATLTNRIERLSPGEGQYTLICRADGGTIDDLIVYRLTEGDYLIVCNASNIAPVHSQVAAGAPADVTVADLSIEYAMLAVQGPAWREAMRPLGGGDEIFALPYFSVLSTTVAGAPSLVARTGYTGEPGVEIMCPTESAVMVWDRIMAGPDAPAPVGLVARDTLRMEMGYPLYGQELSLDRTPIEAGLKWACDMEGGFTGAEVMRRQVEEGTTERLCAFRLDEPGIPRTGCAVMAGEETVGAVTSGTMSPTLGIGIGMAYVRNDLAAPGTALTIDIRGKRKAATVAKRPLVDTSPTKEL